MLEVLPDQAEINLYDVLQRVFHEKMGGSLGFKVVILDLRVVKGMLFIDLDHAASAVHQHKMALSSSLGSRDTIHPQAGAITPLWSCLVPSWPA